VTTPRRTIGRHTHPQTQADLAQAVKSIRPGRCPQAACGYVASHRLVISLIAGVATARVNMSSAEIDLLFAGLTPIAITIALWPEMRDGVGQRIGQPRRRKPAELSFRQLATCKPASQLPAAALAYRA
jgi:hypothetical protein